MTIAKPQISPNNSATSPHGWQRVKLGEVCEILMGQSPEGSSYNNEGKGEPLLNGPTEFGPESPTATQWTTEPTRFCQAGDVLLCVRGSTTGRKNIADKRYCIGRGLAAIRGKKHLTETAFIWFALDHVTRKILSESAGSTFPNISGDKLERVLIPLPPLLEQRRIAGRLREQLAAAAQARAAVQAQLDAAKVLPAAHLRAVFKSPLAQRWPRRRLDELCDLLPSRAIALSGDTEVRAITSACLTETGFSPLGVKTARMWAGAARDSIVSPGEILVARSNTPELVGRVCIYGGEPKGVVASDLTVRLWPGDQTSGNFLASYLSFLFVSGYWKDRAGGASGTMKKITRSQITAENVPTPSFAEQRAIASQLQSAKKEAAGLTKTLTEKLTALDHLPAALLREAFTGTPGWHWARRKIEAGELPRAG